MREEAERRGPRTTGGCTRCSDIGLEQMWKQAFDEEVINTAMKEVIPTKASTVNLNALGRTPIFETIDAGMRHCRK